MASSPPRRRPGDWQPDRPRPHPPLSFDATVSATADEVRLENAEIPVNRADFGLTYRPLRMASLNNTITVHAVFTRRLSPRAARLRLRGAGTRNGSTLTQVAPTILKLELGLSPPLRGRFAYSVSGEHERATRLATTRPPELGCVAAGACRRPATTWPCPCLGNRLHG